MEEKKRVIGRPIERIIKSPQDMRDKIEAYFAGLMVPLRDKSGSAVVDEDGNPVMVTGKPATVTGLALALGLRSRQALINYQGRPEYTAIVEEAKLRIEAYAEARLYDHEGCNGAKFALSVNWGWVDRQDIGLAGGMDINVKTVD